MKGHNIEGVILHHVLTMRVARARGRVAIRPEHPEEVPPALAAAGPISHFNKEVGLPRTKTPHNRDIV